MNFETLEKQPETFISSQYGELRDDVVWRLKTKGDQWCFLYIITEFQSSVVRHMAARIDEYVGVLRMDLIRSGVINTGDPYPLILPIVLYRGVPKWTAPLSLTEMQGIVSDSLLSYCEQRYFLIDIHRLAEESLKDQKTIPAVFFQMERAASWEELKGILWKACIYFKGDRYKEIRETFLYWAKFVGMPRFSIPADEIANSNSLEELVGMSYAYSCKEEEEYYTKWRKDLESNAYNNGKNDGEKNGEKNASVRIAKNLASMGMDTDKIILATGLSGAEVQAALQVNP